MTFKLFMSPVELLTVLLDKLSNPDAVTDVAVTRVRFALRSGFSVEKPKTEKQTLRSAPRWTTKKLTTAFAHPC
jgi:hypothetical protein